MNGRYDKMLNQQKAIISNIDERYDKMRKVQDFGKCREILQQLSVLSNLEDIQYSKGKKCIDNMLKESRSKGTNKEWVDLGDLELATLENMCKLRDEIMGVFLHEKMEVDEKMAQIVHEKKEAIHKKEHTGYMKHVGPFEIRNSKVPHDKVCKYLEHCYENVQDIQDIAGVEDSNCFHVNKKRFFEDLMPEKWLSNVLINHVTDVLNIRQIRTSLVTKRPIQRWFFPMDHRHYRIDSSKSKTQYQIKRDELQRTKQIFFPLLKDKHWNLIVFNNEERKVEVWDSLASNLKDFQDDINLLCVWLDDITKPKVSFKTYVQFQPDVPKQPNMYDCGVYVCHCMEYPDEVMKFHKENWISTEQRCLLAIRILKAPENTFTHLKSFEYKPS